MVTALYELDSKQPLDFYLRSLCRIWRLCPSPILLFTSKDLLSLLDEMPAHPTAKRSKRVLPREQWKAWEALGANASATGDALHYQAKLFAKHIKQNISRDLIAIWQQKRFFVQRAIEENPFQTPWFVWLDAGSARNVQMADMLAGFPDVDRLESTACDKVMVQMLESFELHHGKRTPFGSLPGLMGLQRKCSNAIGASIIAGTAHAWLCFINDCQRELDKLVQAWRPYLNHPENAPPNLPLYASDEHLMYQVFFEVPGSMHLIPTLPLELLGDFRLQARWWGFLPLFSTHCPPAALAAVHPIHFRSPEGYFLCKATWGHGKRRACVKALMQASWHRSKPLAVFACNASFEPHPSATNFQVHIQFQEKKTLELSWLTDTGTIIVTSYEEGRTVLPWTSCPD